MAWNCLVVPGRGDVPEVKAGVAQSWIPGCSRAREIFTRWHVIRSGSRTLWGDTRITELDAWINIKVDTIEFGNGLLGELDQLCQEIIFTINAMEFGIFAILRNFLKALT